MIADTPRTHAELLKLLIDNTSGAITPQVLRDLLVSLDLYPLNVKRFGAKGDGLADDTAAIQAAIAESHVYPPDRYLPVYFPPGDYLCHEVAWNGKAPLVGFEVGNSRLLYNDPGGPKSAVIRYEEDSRKAPSSATKRTKGQHRMPGFRISRSSVWTSIPRRRKSPSIVT